MERIARTARSSRTNAPVASRTRFAAPMRVIVHNQEGPGGAEDVFVSVNGKAWLIKRENEATLPPEVLEVLENAEQAVFERDPDGVQREKRLKRFAYSVLGPACDQPASEDVPA